MNGTNKLTSALLELISAFEFEFSSEGQIRARDAVEQIMFELFVGHGYHTAEARKLAIHICDAMEE